MSNPYALNFLDIQIENDPAGVPGKITVYDTEGEVVLSLPSAIFTRETTEIVIQKMAFAFEVGHGDGVYDAKLEIRKALGVKP